MTTNEAYVICHSAKAPAVSRERGARPPVASIRPRMEDLVASCDLDRALVEAAEELDFDWPEFLPAERVVKGITEIALGLALVAGIAAFWCFLWFDFLKR
jgi:hypothetical protein